MRTIDPKTYLEIYRSYPQAIFYNDMNKIQGRLLISHDFLLNPESGVKIYTYNTMTDEQRVNFKKELTALVTSVLEEPANKIIRPDIAPFARASS